MICQMSSVLGPYHNGSLQEILIRPHMGIFLDHAASQLVTTHNQY